MKNTNRRDAIKNALAIIPAGMALWATTNVFAAGGKVAATPGLKLVSETDPTAKALKYVADASKANPKPQKRGVTEGKDQNCANCQLYTKQGEIDGKEVGKCLMIQGGSVTAAGWCASWTKKA